MDTRELLRSQLTSRTTEIDPITIVVAEGDALVRAVIEESLTSYGYRVLAAQDGFEVLRMIIGYSGSLPLLIADFALPLMNAQRLAEVTSRLCPGMTTLYLLGIPTQCDGLRPLSRCLHKPFTPLQLIKEVRAILNALPDASSEDHSRGVMR